MRTVKVPVVELLEKVKANRAGHRAIFEEAQAGYRAAAIKELDAMLAEARSGKIIRRHVELVEPMDMTKEYDKVIAMLEMTNEETVELSSAEFSQYVLDDWSWKDQFSASNVGYLNTR